MEEEITDHITISEEIIIDHVEAIQVIITDKCQEVEGTIGVIPLIEEERKQTLVISMET